MTQRVSDTWITGSRRLRGGPVMTKKNESGSYFNAWHARMMRVQASRSASVDVA